MVFVFCPPYCATGGTELLHQLVFQLNALGVNCKITYGKINPGSISPTPDRFKKYISDNFILDEPQDIGSNVLIFPEVFGEHTLKYKNAKKIFWWLSVDNFYVSINEIVLRNRFLRKFSFYREYKYHKLVNNFLNPSNFNLHLYQSEYARLHLNELNIKNHMPLSDYLNTEFFRVSGNFTNRENIVLYNPKKGFEFVKELIGIDASNKWIALENKTPEQLHELYSMAKIYIDFGNHPGKDRIPREAVINGCILISSNFGSAANQIDVPILAKYKLNKIKLIESTEVLDFINSCISQYDKLIDDFIPYRMKISQERALFHSEVENLALFLKGLK